MNRLKDIICKTALALAFAGVAGCTDHSRYQAKEEAPGKPIPVEEVLIPAPDDTVTTVAWAFNDNLSEVEQNTPQIFRDLSLMEKLPLTGKYIYDILKNPANGIMTFLVPVPAGEPLNSHYYSIIKNADIARGAGSLSTFHEYFHAAQDVNDGSADMSTLTMKDAIFANLLQEASAVAYELSVRQEAANQGIHLFAAKKTVIAGDTLTTMYTSGHPEVRNIFRDAYLVAWKKNADEEKSLEAGGKAVVCYLMEGKDSLWMTLYTQQVILNMLKNYDSFRDDGRALKPGYKSRRSDFYSRQGIVSPRINLIPDGYLGADADQYIDKCLAVVLSPLFQRRLAQKNKPLSPG